MKTAIQSLKVIFLQPLTSTEVLLTVRKSADEINTEVVLKL